MYICLIVSWSNTSSKDEAYQTIKKKEETTACYLPKTHLKHKDTEQVKVKVMKKHYVNTNQKKAETITMTK